MNHFRMGLKFSLFLVISGGLAGNVLSRETAANCDTWEGILRAQTIGNAKAKLQNPGRPDITLERALRPFSNISTTEARKLMERVVLSIWEDPVKGEKYLASGHQRPSAFRVDCYRVFGANLTQ
jgi:hypothetical protein